MKILVIGFLAFLGLLGVFAAFWPGGSQVWFHLGGFEFTGRMVLAAAIAAILCWNLK